MKTLNNLLYKLFTTLDNLFWDNEPDNEDDVILFI